MGKSPIQACHNQVKNVMSNKCHTALPNGQPYQSRMLFFTSESSAIEGSAQICLLIEHRLLKSLLENDPKMSAKFEGKLSTQVTRIGPWIPCQCP